MDSESEAETMASEVKETAHTDTDNPETVLPKTEESPDEKTFSQTDEETETDNRIALFFRFSQARKQL
mgnify:CR=1 FL=1